MLLTSSSDGIEASVLKRPYTPPPKCDRPKKGPSRFEWDDSAHFFDESETCGLPPQSELPHASTTSSMPNNAGIDFHPNQVNNQ